MRLWSRTPSALMSAAPSQAEFSHSPGSRLKSRRCDVELLAIVNTLGAITTIVAAIMIASNYSPKVMVIGFAVFVIASLMWVWSGYLDEKPSLIVQNAVLLLVNLAGIWRWLPRAA